MKTATFVFAGLAALVSRCVALGVVGKPDGFAADATGGGSATPQVPKDIKELESWLMDKTPRVIVLDKEFNFKGSMGTVTEAGCRPASNTCGSAGQDAINKANWCHNGNAGAGAKSITVTYDKAATLPINVGSNKSIVGVGAKGVMRGRGLRIANGAKNIIIQNIHFTDMNHAYIWGGDALTIAGSDLVWIDHCKFSLIGRQFIVLGLAASGRVTISNNELDGQTTNSATCDGHHYWTLYLEGSGDFVTLQNNYIHHTSGRGPRIGGNTVLHAVNNYWYEISGHAFDIFYTGVSIVAEGNVFKTVHKPLLENLGKLFTSPTTAADEKCTKNLGHTCKSNSIGTSGAFVGTDTSFLSKFVGKTVANANAATANVALTAGVGKI